MDEGFWYQETFFCMDCIGDSYLKKQIEESGIEAECWECKHQKLAISCEDLGERLHKVIESHYQLTPEEPEGWELYYAKEHGWDRSGDEANYIVQEIAEVSLEIANELLEYLAEQYDPAGKDALISPSLYGDAHYVSKDQVDDYEYEYRWDNIKISIKEESRFFNHSVKDTLNVFFRNIDQLFTHDDQPIVKTIDADTSFYRARVAHSRDEELEILEKLPAALGAPPSALAKPGRMNAGGISVFYGAMSPETCIAEVRPWVGCSVIVGKFNPVTTLKILDLSLLEKINIEGSLFDSNHIENLARVQFLSKLVREISIPITPGAEDSEYLITQLIAEYLQSELGLDGILFDSVQFKNKTSESESGSDQNLVLFKNSSLLQPYEIPSNIKIDASFSIGDPEDPEPRYSIMEKITSDIDEPYGSIEDFDSPSPTITLNLKSITIHQIQGVSFLSSALPVDRYRYDPKDFVWPAKLDIKL